MAHREPLFHFVWGREEKSSHIVPLTAVTVRRKLDLKCPHWMQPKRLEHIKMALCVRGPSPEASAASKALFKGPTESYFLSCHCYASVCG